MQLSYKYSLDLTAVSFVLVSGELQNIFSTEQGL